MVSADGRYVAFYSDADNLVPGDDNDSYDVFVRDRQTGTTTLVSGGVSGPGDGSAFDPSVSADGRYVAFYSNATNLVPGGSNGNYQVFVRDLQAGTTTLVSAAPMDREMTRRPLRPSAPTAGISRFTAVPAT